MSDNDHRLYWYPEIRELVITRDSIYVRNSPMNNRTLKAHKGLCNEIIFNIRDRDRKLQNMSAYEILAHVIDPQTGKREINKMLEHTLDVGKAKLVLTEGDLVNMEPGLYHMYIARQIAGQPETLPFYKDQDNNVRFDLEVTDQASTTPIASQETTTFLQTSNVNLGDDANSFVSDAMYGNLCRNFENAQHTLVMFFDDYLGNITIQGSCLNNSPAPQQDSKDWFNIQTIQISNTTTQTNSVTNFTVNCNWIRVVSTPDQGTIDRIVLRN
jgi:hypothetical protein